MGVSKSCRVQFLPPMRRVDFSMTAAEVQPVLQALRTAGIHVVALHDPMVGERPAFYFTHFWGKGKAARLAEGLRSALDARKAAGKTEGH